MDLKNLKDELINLLPEGAAIDDELLDKVTGGISPADGKEGLANALASLGLAEEDLAKLRHVLTAKLASGSVDSLASGNVGKLASGLAKHLAEK